MNVHISHIATTDADFIVPDSREGWVKLLRNILNAYLFDGKGFSYSTILIRGAGEKINGFGGTASGPVILIDGMEKICSILDNRVGKKLRSIDVLDICNIIGSIVVAGNVRRSAQIALGDPDDFLFLRAKRWDLGNIPNWRSMSNNTLYADSFDHISETVWSGFQGNGEPYGFFNIPLSQKYGRLGEQRLDSCEGTNPCAEISLSDKECCNLSELYLNNIENKEELIDIAKLLYKTQKAICAMNFIHEETNEIVHKNMRIGLGVTGVCQSLHKLDWLDDAYKELRKFDKEWSKLNGWNTSIKLTTVKPSGTLSILAGSTPGVHPGFSRYHIRRVRMSSNDPLVSYCTDLGYDIEYLRNFDGTQNRGTVVVSFPCVFDGETVIAKDMTAVDQLELVKKLQTVWADNAVSVTVYYKAEELPEIQEWLKKNYKTSIKSVSFLLHSEHGFDQAPYEEVDEKKYKILVKKLKNIELGNSVAAAEETSFDDLECAGGACPIK
jgi:ribonucleotide reductase alpha subunit